MKKHFALAFLAIAGMASAGDGIVGEMQRKSGGGYGAAGCGLGSLLFGEQKGLVQIAAATTNDFYSNQTFAITTGTSNCTEDGVALIDRERALFAEANFDVIKQEIAMGQGENVAVLASLYGCDGASVGSFGSAVQASYGTIGKSASAPEMLDAIDGVVRSNAALTTCHSN